ncbi:dihydrodipicolinate synthase family protein [Cellulomonas sp. HZM]|uniref:dihydrodipicolinate synthase family protein n=1 Tax=Cellulomonas sp. HZM TaxID=1454010 RepID=UPI0004931E53|nr:dihydrodipicolinate synthase family protein [Cellulomonas sp. HZM]
MVGPLVAYLPTPRAEDGRVLTDALAVLVERAVAAGADAVAVLGSAGGFAYLDRAQRASVVSAAAGAVSGRVPLLAGIGALTTSAAQEHARDAGAAGADGLLLGTPTYLPLTTDEVVGLYRDVAAHAPAPLWAYHNPRTTSVELSVDDVRRIATLPGIAGVKDRGVDADDVRTRVAAYADLDVEVGISGDLLGVEGLLAGARAWHCGLAGLLPELYVPVARAAAGGDEAAVRAATSSLAPWAELSSTWGVARLAVVLGPLLGLDLGTVPRPLLAPPDHVRERVVALLG